MPDDHASTTVLQVRLVLRDERDGSVREHVTGLPITIGRNAAPDVLVITDRAVSRRHARLEFAGLNVLITDLDSANGTFVNGGRIREQRLGPEDRVTIGPVEITWSHAGVESDTTFVAPSGLRPRETSAARRVVEAAERHNGQVGHELDGFLSIEHGFLPREPPLLALPDSHRVWDELADGLPALFTGLDLRRAFDRIPVLDASPDALPDRYLHRASTMLGVFAHSYQYVETDPPPALPASILAPWREVSRRLGKDIPSVSYVDLFLYNWRLRDPTGPRRLDNMDLLVPAWGNTAERIFSLVTTEFAMELTPVLDAMLRAQEAVLADDRDGVAAALLVVLDQLHHVTQVIYPQIDPNPLSATHLDQVLWAKTVGTAGVPIFDGAPSPAGTAQPQIHALDAFFDRQSYHSMVGRQSVLLAGQFPRHWRELVDALRRVSVRAYIERIQDPALRGLYNAALDAYIGDKGWMGLHRIKAYGFLEVAFKVGRSVTTGAKFTGLFRDKTWEKIDAELAEVRDERRPAGHQQVYFGRARTGVVTTEPSTGSWTNRVDLDVSGQGVHHRPGDRVGILPENDAALVRRTLQALRATGDEVVSLSPRWQEAIRLRAGHGAGTEVLPLRSVVQFGRIRPVSRDVGKLLLGCSASGALKRILDAHMEDQWELWDLLNVLHAGGYDVTRLWTAAPTDPESICHVVPPETFRLYSIASAVADPRTGAETIRIVVGGLSYTTPRTTYSYERERAGTATQFVRRVSSDARASRKELSLTIVPTPRFRLPTDVTRPVLMFAAGSGIAPFHGFLQARSRQPDAGENRLFLGLRRPAEFADRAALEKFAADGQLELRTAFSQADVTAVFDTAAGTFGFPEAPRRRVDALIAEPEQAAVIWDAIRGEADGGREGYLYVCGSADFAASVLTALRGVVRRFSTGSEQQVDTVVRRMVAQGRLNLDVFTTYRGNAQQGRTYDVSTLVLRNTDAAGHWMAVGGKVYDLTEFLHQHVGGPQIVRHYVGMDATSAYRGVLHDLNPEVEAMLSMYELGSMRRLDFQDGWGVVLTADGLRFTLLEGLFTAWVRYVYLVVSMENALENDFGFAHAQATSGSAADELTPFKVQFLVESHRRFLTSYLDGLVEEDLPHIWELTIGFCAPGQDIRRLTADLDAIRAGPAFRLVRGSVALIKDLLTGRRDVVGGRTLTKAQRISCVTSLCQVFRAEDRRVLQDMKTALCTGIVAFEQHQADVVALGGDRLMTAVSSTLAAVADYYVRLADRIVRTGITIADVGTELADEPVPEDRGLPGHGGLIRPAAASADRPQGRP